MDVEKEASKNEKKTMMNSVTNDTKPPRQPVETRKTYILGHIVTKTIEEIAYDMGVTRRTIHRDIDALKASGKWNEWLEVFLLKLYSSDDVSDDAKLRSVTMLYGKTMVQRTQVEAEIKGGLTILFDKGMEDNGEPKDQLHTP